MLKQQGNENVFAPEGYEQVLRNWPETALPQNNTFRNFSAEDIARGRMLMAEGLDALAAACGVTDPELVERWRSRWNALPAGIDGTYSDHQAPTALYAELSFRWFKTAEAADECVAFFAQDGIRVGTVRKKMASSVDYRGRTRTPKLPTVDLYTVVAKVNRSRMSPADYRRTIEIHGSAAVHRMVESLEEGSLDALLDEGFPIRYMADVPPKWTRFLDVVAKAAYTGVPHDLLPRMFEMMLSADDADYLFSTVAPEYMSVMLQP